MTILQTAYQTLSLRGLDTRATVELIAQAINAKHLVPATEDSALVFITTNSGVNADIPAFAHPLMVNAAGKDYVVMDLRYVLRESRDHELQVRHPADFQLALLRASLTEHWLREGPRPLLSVTGSALGGYAKWIASALFSQLSPQDLITVEILAGFYYFCQFTDEDKLSESERRQVLNLLERYLRYPASMTYNLVVDLPPINSLEAFCTVVKEQTQSTRLKDLNQGLLVAMLSNGWFGIHAKEIVASAVEHPPTWVALCAMAISSRIHHRTKVAKVVERAVRRSDQPLLVRAAMNLSGAEELAQAALNR